MNFGNRQAGSHLLTPIRHQICAAKKYKLSLAFCLEIVGNLIARHVIWFSRKARAQGRGAGMHFWGGVDQQVRFLEMGCNFMIHSADLLIVRDHLASELNAIRQRMGDLPQGDGGPDGTI